MPSDRVLPDAVVADATVRRWGRCFADVDRRMVRSCRALRPRVARIALALVYLWFGLVKLTGHSDAGPLAAALTARTIGSAHFALAFNTLAVFECLIGIVVLVRRARALVPPLIGLHLAVVCSPLVLVPHLTWQGFLLPTMDGQYILKNALVVAAAMAVYAP